jgi:hypothetical protein
MPIYLVDDTLKIEVFYEPSDRQFEDDICLCIEESCPPEEKLFRADEVHIYLTPRQARQLGLALVQAAKMSSDRVEEG